jgi:hypothetical protein
MSSKGPVFRLNSPAGDALLLLNQDTDSQNPDASSMAYD